MRIRESKGGLFMKQGERRLALATMVLVSFWGIITWIVEPLWGRIQELGTHADAKTDKLEVVTRLLAKQPMIETQQQYFSKFLAIQSDELAKGSLLNAMLMLLFMLFCKLCSMIS